MIFTRHAMERAKERHGITASPDEWRQAYIDLLDTIAGERRAAMLLGRFEYGAERWMLNVGGHSIVVIYLPVHAAIVTVLPAGKNMLLKTPRLKQSIRGRRRQEKARETGADD